MKLSIGENDTVTYTLIGTDHLFTMDEKIVDHPAEFIVLHLFQSGKKALVIKIDHGDNLPIFYKVLFLFYSKSPVFVNEKNLHSPKLHGIMKKTRSTVRSRHFPSKI